MNNKETDCERPETEPNTSFNSKAPEIPVKPM